MAFYPPESLDVSWSARNKSWRHIGLDRKDVVLDLPLRYRHLSIDHLPKTTAGKTVAAWCARWGAYPTSGIPLDFDSDDFRGRGLFLFGPAGTGKTTMAAIATQYVSDLGWSTRFIRAQDYWAYSRLPMDAVDPYERERLQWGFDAYEAGWKGWKLVTVDDLGHERRTGSGYSENLVENLLRARFPDGAPTIVTSNIDPDSTTFKNRYGETLSDFLHESCWQVPVEGRSRRRAS